MHDRKKETALQKVARVGAVISIIIWFFSSWGDMMVILPTPAVVLIFTLFNPIVWIILYNIK